MQRDPCAICSGTGKLEDAYTDDPVLSMRICAHCNGTGQEPRQKVRLHIALEQDDYESLISAVGEEQRIRRSHLTVTDAVRQAIKMWVGYTTKRRDGK